MKIMDKIIFGIYIIAFIANICVCVMTKNGDRVVIAMWIFGAMMNYWLLKEEEKNFNERIKWRDELIKELLRERAEKNEEE